MDDPTTTDVVTQDSGAEYAQPVEQPTEAVQTTDPEPTINDQPVAEAPTDGDDDYTGYWDKKGIDISTPEGQAKAAKSYAEAEKAMHQKAQKASELEKQLTAPTGTEYDNDRIARVETMLTTRDFFDRNPGAKELEADMAAYITENPIKRELIKNGYMTLDEVHAIVSSDPNRTSRLKAEGRQEGLQDLANKQRATAVAGNAVQTTPAQKVTSDNVETWWESIGAEGRQKPENRAIADRLL